MPKKTTTKKTRKPTLPKEPKLGPYATALVNAMSVMNEVHNLYTDAEKRQRLIHEDIVAQIEANRARLIRIESRLPAPPVEVEARKKAAEAAKLAKPIEFGTRVMYDGIEHLVCIDAPASDGDWLLTRKGENDAWWVPRHEFTIVNG